MPTEDTSQSRRVGEPANGEPPRRRFADRLAARKDARWNRALDWREVPAGGFKTPAQACPRGCSRQTASRELLTWTGWSGRTHSRVLFEFETNNCPDCGSWLLDRCQRCEEPFAAPVGDRCEHCGLPQPWSPERLSSTKRLPLRRWAPNDADVHDPARAIYPAKGHPQLLIIEDDVTNIAVEAVVSNDDVDGRMYTVIASAIKAAAGQQVEDESIEHGRAALGDAWSTAAGALRKPLKRIVHVAAVDRRGNSSIEVVVDCVRSALGVARHQKLESLAIAAFGTGTGDGRRQVIDLDDWLSAVGPAIVSDLQESPGSPPLAVLLVLYGPEDFAARVELLKSAVQPLLERGPQAEAPSGGGAPTPLSEAAERQRRQQLCAPAPMPSEEDHADGIEPVDNGPDATKTRI